MTVEYETERQQRVLILLDAGRMMSSTLGRLTKLDHAVNTAFDAELRRHRQAIEVRPSRYRGRGARVTTRRAVDTGNSSGSREPRRLRGDYDPSRTTAAFPNSFAQTARRAFAIVFTDPRRREASRGLVAAVTQLAGTPRALLHPSGSAARRGRGSRTEVIGRCMYYGHGHRLGGPRRATARARQS